MSKRRPLTPNEQRFLDLLNAATRETGVIIEGQDYGGSSAPSLRAVEVERSYIGNCVWRIDTSDGELELK